MEFLLTREYDADFAATVAGILPGDVFNSDFTRRFVDTWREEASKNEDLFTAFAEKLSSYEREWFDKIYLGAGKTEASALTSIEILRDFACKFWIERLKRERNSVSLNADVDSEIKRMRLSMDIKRLTSGDWNVVAELIKNLMKGEK